MDSTIEKYKPQGMVSVWRFPDSKNYQGLNISFDNDARNSLIKLVQLMLDSQWPSKKIISLKTPLELDQNWITTVGKIKTYRNLSIAKLNNNINSFDIQESGDLIKLNFDEEGLNEFKQKLIDNTFDEGLETSDTLDCLYFW